VDFTPFPWITYYPVQILTGKLEWLEVARVMGIQCLWILGFAVLRQIMWRAGLKKYGAVGA
jgi:ABC-2 type transport system permease protein